MWYKPLECDAIVLATNAHAAASLLGQVELGNPSDTPGNPGDTPGNAKRSVAAERLERLRSAAARTRGAACWSLTVAFDAPLRLKYDALKLRAPFDGNIVFIANESSKPRRGAAASAGWGYRWAEVGRAPAAAPASAGSRRPRRRGPPSTASSRRARRRRSCAPRFCPWSSATARAIPEPVHCKATRWRFAFPTPDDDEDQLIYGGNQNEPGREIRREKTKKTPYVFDPSLMLGACGDWASGPGAGTRTRAARGARRRRREALRAPRAADEAA